MTIETILEQRLSAVEPTPVADLQRRVGGAVRPTGSTR